MAAEYCRVALNMEVARLKHRTTLMLAIVYLHQKDERAEQTFADAAAQCRLLLKNSPGLYEPRYKLATCLVGSAIFDPEWNDISQRLRLSGPAIAEYRSALEICSAVGIVKEAERDLEIIREGGVDGLAVLISLLRNE